MRGAGGNPPEPPHVCLQPVAGKNQDVGVTFRKNLENFRKLVLWAELECV